MEQKLNDLISQIKPLDDKAVKAASERQTQLTKPAGSLGRLEEISIQIAGIQGKETPKIEKKAVVVMAGDHGVVAEGVSAFPQEVTPQMVFNMLAGGAAINVLSRHNGVDVVLVDMGVAAELEDHPELINKKVRLGTSNMAEGPAMSREEAVRAVLAGAEVVSHKIEEGVNLVATGDMGIGNTTPSAAIAAVFTQKPVADIVGRGTGVDDEGLKRKIAAVKKAIDVNQPDSSDGLDVLAKVGGFEIAGIAGVILGAAASGAAVVVDGFISTAGAMIAAAICPQVKDYLISGHNSQELGHILMLEYLGIKPVVDLDFRLGEGTGAVVAISIVEAACKILAEMATFAEAGVSDKD